jgi:tryptophan synthase beta subunit
MCVVTSILRNLRRKEGIVPALEPSHALHQTMEFAKSLPKDKIVFLGTLQMDSLAY